MEFYDTIKAIEMIAKEFQFPTGWNSTILSFIIESISSKFQFPTGWNSTQANRQARSRRQVSIPNGMEFYTASHIEIVGVCVCFNSQRDGILLGIAAGFIL